MNTVTTPFACRFAILDVSHGREELKARIDRGEKLHIVVEGYLDAIHGKDDGISREFSMTVTGLVEIQP